MKTNFSGLLKRAKTILFLVAMLSGATGLSAKSQKTALDDVVAHLSLNGNDAAVIAQRQVQGHHYVFISQPSQKAVIVLDVTNPKKPRVTKNVDYPGGAQSAGEIFGTNLLLVKGEKAGESGPTGIVAFGAPEGVDGSQPFTGLTSFLADEDRGLVYFTNADGLWIVRVKHTPRQDAIQEMDLTGIYG
ncbi:MAG TPA: hypothetical protein VF860_04595 [Candidatus Acidoferrales bacterium]